MAMTTPLCNSRCAACARTARWCRRRRWTQSAVWPVALDINEILSSVSHMARRLIGTDVQLQQELATSVAQVLADPAQIEQVLLNLIVNARDAMPTGGMITVQTANVRLEADSPEMSRAGLAPGPFVLSAVSDNGIGMDQSTQARICEPLFTTKETGRGTGFRVYLPAVAGEPLDS